MHIYPPSPLRFAQQLRSGGSTLFALINVRTETRTYVGLTGTQAFDGFKGLRVDTRYTGVPQEDGTVLVATVGAPMGASVKVSSEEKKPS